MQCPYWTELLDHSIASEFCSGMDSTRRRALYEISGLFYVPPGICMIGKGVQPESGELALDHS